MVNKGTDLCGTMGHDHFDTFIQCPVMQRYGAYKGLGKQKKRETEREGGGGGGLRRG